MAGQPQVAGCRDFLGAGDEPAGAAGEPGDFLGLRYFRGGFQVGGDAVVPTAIEPPNVAGQKLRLVIDGLQVGEVA